ncbi:hypothetical protein [Thalassobacter stenotrophicus]|uniref:hypothetical protein n=1 Tax=Thalassobacter stenotrophicus TaxID=266809 RepID=UPI000D5D99B2|nr:hypothetical protein [Thalassobacter stenotrophicus]PVZ48385.1 hypothetical protein DD557_06360 [Thalassobacter stenotrophicus]
MTPEYAAAIIRSVVANRMKENLTKEGHGRIYRYLMGLRRKDINKKKIVLSQTNMGIAESSPEHPSEAFVCFWVLMNKPTTSTDIMVNEATGVVQTLTGAVVGSFAGTGHFGSGFQKVSEMKSAVGDVTGTAGLAKTAWTGGAGINEGLNKAWRAGMWDHVTGTRSEFTFALDEALVGGCAAISGPIEDWVVDMRMWPDRDTLLSFIGYAENKGVDTPAARQYIRGLCTQLQWRRSDFSSS